MGATAHIDFIAAAYTAAVIIIGALIAWVTLDFRALRRTLAKLEMQGFSRRSDPSSAEREAPKTPAGAREKAKEKT